MASARQSGANRANAKRSTGPRSQSGKATVGLNARRHGLAMPLRAAEIGTDAEIERLAGAIAAEAVRPDLLDLARRIAEAEIDLRRIRRVRRATPARPRPASPDDALFAATLRRVYRRKNACMNMLMHSLHEAGWNPESPESIEELSNKSAIHYTEDAVERYERRAVSRRKSAMRNFDIARFAGEESGLRRGLNGGRRALRCNFGRTNPIRDDTSL